MSIIPVPQNDVSVALEAVLLISVPVGPIVAGLVLRRRFPRGPVRVAGTVLLWLGLAATTTCLVFALNYLGVI